MQGRAIKQDPVSKKKRKKKKEKCEVKSKESRQAQQKKKACVATLIPDKLTAGIKNY
jgi:hypothetical protein